MANDYQNNMSGITLAADKAGNDAAKGGNMTSEIPSGPDKWGLLPGMAVPMDFAIGRQEFFRHEIQRTVHDGVKVPFMDDEKIAGSGALKTQKEMLNNYTSDITIMPGAEMQYNMFAPLAGQAAQAVLKADNIGANLGMDTNQQTSKFMDKKHLDSLKKAVVAEGMQQGDSISAKGKAVGVARKGMVSAADKLKIVFNQQVIKKLNEEVAKSAEEQTKIEEKIKKVEKWAGYAEKAVGLIAGGAGALAGAGGAVVAEEGMADTTMTSIKEGAEKGEKGIGIAGKIAGGIAELYYEDQVRTLKATMTAAKGQIEGWGLANESLALEGAQAAMDGATEAYKLAVDQYQAAIQDRRMHMAKAGAAADKGAAPDGDKKQIDSQAMLWIEAVMEAQSRVGVAKAAGTDAQTKLKSVGATLSEHRNHAWSNIEDIWGNGGGADRTEGSGGPDVHAVAVMGRLTDSWLAGAGKVEQMLAKSIGDDKAGEKKTLGDAGYSGDM